MPPRLGVLGRALVALTLVAACSGLSSAQTKPKAHRLCGSFAGRGELALQYDVLFARTPVEQKGITDLLGNIAVIEADGNLVRGGNPFDLLGTSLRFAPDGNRYTVGRDSSELDLAAGRKLNLGDEDYRNIEIPFPFRFYGQNRERVFINSNGYLSFMEGETFVFPSEDVFVDDLPRVAPLFNDLDPSAGGEVRLVELPDRIVVTWERVPEWDTSNESTFQVELRPDGSIIFRYGAKVDAATGIVGISPGNRIGMRVVNLGNLPTSSSGALFERFFTDPVVNVSATVRRFYESFSDDYDIIVFWTNFASDLDDAFAFHLGIKNEIRGIGAGQFDFSREWGSEGELEGVSFMGNIDRYPEEPRQPIYQDGVSTLELLAHENGHRWLAYADAFVSGYPRDVLLGRGRFHWSFFLDSDASVMEGNDFAEESSGRFRSVEIETRYSSLDLYLMGFAPPAEVAPFYFITDANGTDAFGTPLTNESAPERGALVTGRRQSALLDDIVRAVGERQPGFESAQKHIREAWILIHRAGSPPTSEQLAKLEAVRNAWPGFFQQLTKGRGSVRTTLP